MITDTPASTGLAPQAPVEPARHTDPEHAFAIEMLHVGPQLLRVARHAGTGKAVPLLLFNGIGGNIELLSPLARALPEREVITFDIPGVGHSTLPRRPYRLKHIVALACGVLDHYGHSTCDVLGISWGGTAAQQFARSAPQRCRRLILCATAAGGVMLPGRPSVLLKMVTPRRFISRSYAHQVAGHIYGGDFRRNPDIAGQVLKHIKWQSRLGYYLQIGAISGWTSVHWLHRLRQPTLVMAGDDDPLIPLINARLMRLLIPNAQLKVFDCGHLFLLTRLDESVKTIRDFLDRP
jgi:poly(3-hydroxyoctanoate) depolymerase